MFTLISSERFLVLGKGPWQWEETLQSGSDHVAFALNLGIVPWGIFRAGMVLTVHPFWQRWGGLFRLSESAPSCKSSKIWTGETDSRLVPTKNLNDLADLGRS